MILESLSNHFFGHSTTPEVAERVSWMFGRYDQEFTGRSVSQSYSGISYSQSVQQREWLEAQAVLRFEQGEFAGILAEGSHAEFKQYFAAPESQAQSIEPFADVAQAQTRQQFSRIKDQVSEVLSTRRDECESGAAAEPSQPVSNAQTTPVHPVQASPEDWKNFI